MTWGTSRGTFCPSPNSNRKRARCIDRRQISTTSSASSSSTTSTTASKSTHLKRHRKGTTDVSLCAYFVPFCRAQHKLHKKAMMMPLSLMMLPLAFAEKDACEDDDGAAAAAAAAADGDDARAEWHCGNDAFVNEPNTYPHGFWPRNLVTIWSASHAASDDDGPWAHRCRGLRGTAVTPEGTPPAPRKWLSAFSASGLRGTAWHSRCSHGEPNPSPPTS